MSSTTILELKESDSLEKQQNGIYRVRLAAPTLIEEGDQLSIRMASIDSAQADQDTIIVSEDETAVGISYAYWDRYYSPFAKTLLSDKTTAVTTPTYDYHLAYSSQQIQQIDNIILTINGFVIYPNATGFGFDVGTFLIPRYKIETVNPDLVYLYPLWWDKVTAPNRFYGCSFTFNYIGEDGGLHIMICTTLSGLDRPPVGNNPDFGPGGGPAPVAELNTIARDVLDGEALILGQVAMFPVSIDGVVLAHNKSADFPKIREGTLQLASVNGYWPLAYAADQKTILYNPGAIPPGGSLGSLPLTAAIPLSAGQFQIKSVKTTNIGAPSRKLHIETAYFNIDPGTYDPAALAVAITEKLAASRGILPAISDTVDQRYEPSNTFFARVDEPRFNDLNFRRCDFTTAQVGTDICFNDINTYQYWDTTTNAAPEVYVGANQIAFEYGKSGSVFQFSYLHTPMQITKQGSQDAVIFRTGDVGNPADPLRYHDVTAASGIVVVGLAPETLWGDQLGIFHKLQASVNSDANGIQFILPEELKSHITEGYLGLGGFPSNNSGTNFDSFRTQEDTATWVTNPQLKAGVREISFDITGLTRGIIGQKTEPNVEGGWFLIEVLDVFRTRGGYIDTEDNKRQMSAVVSSQFNNNNVVTGYAQSAIPIIHQGSPYLITEATVRILNSEKQPAAGLGDNNCVWIQIDRAAPEPSPSPLPIDNMKKKSKKALV